MKWFILVVIAFALAVVGLESGRWYLAGRRSDWVILNDPTSRAVVVASDSKGFRILVAAPPSPAWKRGVQPAVMAQSPLDAQQQYEAATRSHLIASLRNGTRAKIIDRAEFIRQVFRAPKPESGAELRREGGIEVIRIEVRDGPYKHLTGWVLPELVQHEVAWP